MKVKCIANTGAGFSEYTINHMGCSKETRLPLHIDKIYIVYGQMIYRGMLQYLIKGTDENLPSWYPAEIFKMEDTLLPLEWYFRYQYSDEVSAIWGFHELVNDEHFIENLIEREDKAIRIFLRRKKEIDEFSE